MAFEHAADEGLLGRGQIALGRADQQMLEEDRLRGHAESGTVAQALLGQVVLPRQPGRTRLEQPRLAAEEPAPRAAAEVTLRSLKVPPPQSTPAGAVVALGPQMA